MKRCGDSKVFIPLISVILILLAGMAMTGCATSSALKTAANNGQTDVVKELLDKGADVNERGDSSLGWGSLTPLICAVYNGHMETVKVMVDRGAELDTPGSFSNWTALMFAVNNGHANIAKFLIEKGADIEGAVAKFKKLGRKDDYEFLEILAKKQQPSRDRSSPPMLPTALPLPTESAKPF